MAVCDICRALLVLSVAFIFIDLPSMVPIYIIVFIIFCFPRFYVPTKMSLIPDLVGKEHLLKANSLSNITGAIAAGIGGLTGAFLIEYYGARVGFIVDALTFFFAAFVVFNLKISSGHSEPQRVRKSILAGVKSTIFDELKEGFVYIKNHKEIMYVFRIIFLMLMAAGAVYVVFIVYVQNVFHSVTKDLGVLLIPLVLGVFSGMLVYGKWGKSCKWHHLNYGCMLSAGVLLIAVILVINHFTNLPLAMVLIFFWGLAIGPIGVATQTMVHLACENSMRGKVFSAMEIVVHAAFMIAMFISSGISSIVGPGNVLLGVGVLCIIIGTMGILTKGIEIKEES